MPLRLGRDQRRQPLTSHDDRPIPPSSRHHPTLATEDSAHSGMEDEENPRMLHEPQFDGM